jgi:hypothetical protein
MLDGALILAAILASCSSALAQTAATMVGGRQTITVILVDSIGRPVAGADVTIETADSRIVARSISDNRGRFRAINLPNGKLRVTARKVGFKPAVREAGGAATNVTLAMEPRGALTLPISSGRLDRFRNQIASDGSALYHFSRDAIRTLPQGDNSTINQVLLQAPWMVQDSNGQALPLAMDDGLQYRIDGVMIPNVQLLDLGQLSPRFAQSIDVLTGALPAELGYRTGAVVDIHTRSGASLNGGGIQLYGGQRGTIEPSFEFGDAAGRLSWFATGYFLHNDRGVNPSTPGPDPINDFTNQGSALGYLSYLLDAHTSVAVLGLSFVHDFGWPANPGQPQQFKLAGVPIFPSADVSDIQFEQTQFGMIALKGRLEAGLDYQLTLFSQYSATSFYPDVPGELIYDGLAARVFRSSFENGSQADVVWNVSGNQIGFGYYFNVENVEIDDHAMTFPGSPTMQSSDVPIAIVDDHNFMQGLYGLYIQNRIRPADGLSINFGVRWDQMVGFLTGHQVSPRIALTYQPFIGGPILHSGAAIYFVPPPSEFIGAEDLQKFAMTTAAAKVPENSKPKPMTNYYFDVGIRQAIARNLEMGIDTFFQLQRDVLDEGQFGSSLIFSPINYRHGRDYGVDATADYRGDNGLSSYMNFAYIVAQVEDVVSGQFNFDPAELAYIANHYVFIDQGQMFSASGGITYKLYGFLFTLTATAGSGLRSGFANTHTMPPYAELDGGVLRDFDLPGIGAAHARMSVINLLDKIYQFHNGSGIGVGSVPQYMPRRALYFGIGAAFSNSHSGLRP